MQTLSTGDPSTLGSYLKLARAVFGPDSGPAKYLERKVSESPHGEAEPVLQAETQMMYLLLYLATTE